MKIILTQWAIWATMLICVAPILAQDSPTFKFEHITVNEGLPHSDAMCMVQDSAGFIWVGTNSGVSKYDGHVLKNYDLPVNPYNGLPSNRVAAIHLDAHNQIWVASGSAGLSLFDKSHDSFVNVATLASPQVNAQALALLRICNVLTIASDLYNRIWIGTRTHGLFVLTFIEGKLQAIEQLPLHQEQSYGVSALLFDKAGTLWIGTTQRGLWKVIPHTTQPIQTSFTEWNIQCLYTDFQGNLWIVTQNDLYIIKKDQTQQQSLSPTHLLFLPELDCVFIDSFKHLWLGTNYGLYYCAELPNPDQPLTLSQWQRKLVRLLPEDGNAFSINSGRIHYIIEDQTRNLWLAASSGGLNKVDLERKPFYLIQRQFGNQPTLPSNYINSMLKDRNNQDLWIGTRNGFTRYNLQNHRYTNFYAAALNGDATGLDVSTFYQLADGTLWVGTRYRGIIVLKNNQKSVILNAGDMSLYATSIEKIVEDPWGTLWVATFEKGLLRFDKTGRFLQRFSAENKNFPSNQCTFLLPIPHSNQMWISTREQGVFKVAITQTGLKIVQHFHYEAQNPKSLSSNYAWPLALDKASNLWVGTIGAGLNKITPQGKVERWSFGYRNAESLAIDKQGNIWIGGDGLVRLNPITRQSIHYDVGDGLQSNSFKIGSVCQDQDGYYYFGGIKGITYFKPEEIKPNSQAPVVRLTTLRIFNKEVKVGENINNRILLTQPLDQTTSLTIAPNENSFSIEFVGLNYKNPKKNQYAYKLLGYNSDWIYTDYTQRIATFSNLDAGDYTLLVKANNGEGYWSAKPAAIHLTVLPPWYKTWWAFLLYTLLIGGAFYQYQKATLARQALKNAVIMEKYKVDKEKEMTDLKLRFFTNVSHELRTPLTLILGPVEELASTEHQQKDKVMLILQQTRKLLDLVNQLLDFRKVESGNAQLRASYGNIVPLIQEIFLIFQLKAQEQGIAYTITLPDDALEMYFDSSKLEIVLTNLLSNAFKYTPKGSQISVTVTSVGSPQQEAVFHRQALVNNYIQITIQDYGVGMSATELEKIFDPYYQASHTETLKIRGTGIGLSLVKQWVEAHKGKIQVTSEIGKGTTFHLQLPFGKAHLSSQMIVKTDEISEQAPTNLTPSENLQVLNPELLTAKVLVVEDNYELRNYLQQLCEAHYDVITAVDGIDGWHKALEHLPDLVISDIMMPNADGLDLCQRIKQNPKTMHIPVLLLTARASVTHEVEGLEMGADEYMAKPFNPLVLNAKVASMLYNRLQLRTYYQKQLLLEPSLPSIPDETRILLEKAMSIVEANLTNPTFTVQTLVKDMGMSQSAFYRQIKALTGQSVVEFIRDVRLKRAAQLLSHGNLRVAEVALMVGIEDVKYFRKMFQQTYEISPSEYAKKAR